MNRKGAKGAMSLPAILEAARAQQWRIEASRGGHLKCFPPDPRAAIVTVAGTPSDHRALRNILAMMRRSGLAY